MTKKNASWALILLAPALAALVGCKSSPANTEVTDTRTNWLAACDSDAECGTALACLCGSCTIACNTNAQCADLDEASACSPTESCGTASAVCTRSGMNATTGSSSSSGGTSSGGAGTNSTPDGGATNAAGSVSTGGANAAGTSSGPNEGGTGGGEPAPVSMPDGGTAGVSGSGAGGSLAGAGGASTASAGSTAGGGLGLGEQCYSSGIAIADTCAAGSYCDPARVCTDSEPPSCSATCTCARGGIQCRTERDGEVLLDQPCCSGYRCVVAVNAAEGADTIYRCQEDTEAECTADCDVEANAPACESQPGFPNLWMCRTTPDEVIAGCVDSATGLPRACCPPNLMPHCVP